MNIFNGNLNAIVSATFVEQERKTPLGVEPGEKHDVRIFVDESYTNAWQSEMISQTSDVLVYAQPNGVLSNKTCVGGTIEYEGRKLRVETFAVARNQRTGNISHIELGCGDI